ncbi:hypothetical protein KFU94_42335 [Chloroflexi bacterium TSY]|nr:hypothetical protein [Chloroflexi bacterium TSY]
MRKILIFNSPKSIIRIGYSQLIASRIRCGLLILFGLFVVAGCTNTQTRDSSSEPQPTIFGRLSQRFQVAGTEEKIAYKLQTNSFFATIDGEVLMERPAILDTVVTDRITGAVRDDVTVTIELCHAVDEAVVEVGSCAAYGGPLYHHLLITTFHDGVYRADGFKWDRGGKWAGTLTITEPDSGETHSAAISPKIYPGHPPSTNMFELSMISLPFIVMGLCLLGIRVFNRRLVLATS